MSDSVFVSADKGIINLSGVVNFTNANIWHQQIVQYINREKSPIISINFSAISQADSAILTLMLSWLRIAKSLGINVSYFAVPEGVKIIAKLYGILELLPIS